MSNELIAVLIGLAAGLHTSTWGMYKDAPHEGFAWPKFFRSTMVGGFAGFALQYVLQFELSQPANIAVFFGGCYVVERALVEFWKTFLRVEDQSKYFIPMQFSVFGKVVESRSTQLAVGLGYVVVVLAIGFALNSLQSKIELPGMLVVLTIGAVGGWLSAFGGAWKDAPKEGFEFSKFVRSPIVALLWAPIFSLVTDDYSLIVFACIGAERMTVEFYKTFIRKKHAKFKATTPRYPQWVQKRARFILPYAVTWIFFFAVLV